MTTAKPYHLQARALYLAHLPIGPLSLGITGDTGHAATGDSYHLGQDQIRPRSGRDRYSVDESSRDQRGLDGNASAMDIGYFEVSTPTGHHTLRDYSLWLVALCRSNDPDTADLREVIYSPDGVSVRRWDRLGRRSSGDNSHLTHTHLSEHRDADGHRMVNLATRYLQHIGLIPQEVPDMDQKDKLTGKTAFPNRTVGDVLADLSNLRDWLITGNPAVLPNLPNPNSAVAQVAAMAKAFPDLVTVVSGLRAEVESLKAQQLPAELATQIADLIAARLQA